MALKSPQIHRPRSIRGGSQEWYTLQASVVLKNLYFDNATSPVKVKVGGVFTSLLSQKVKLSGTFNNTTPKVKVSGVFI